MAEIDRAELHHKAEKVLRRNDRGIWTVPAADLYPHQWLWDSCFIAIGLRHINLERAKKEILSLLRGQWSDGMLPHIVFDSSPQYKRDREIWRSRVNPYAPHEVATSGLTQPPMLAEAVVAVGKKMKLPERRSWYRQVFPHLARYHEWLYAQRDPHQEGLVILIHPYECGLDNTLPWISELRKHSMPWWVSLIEKLRLDWLINMFRRDTRHVPPGQRMSNIEALAYWGALRRLRRKAYNSEAILSRSLFSVQDLTFNSILIRANDHLKQIAETIKGELSLPLIESMTKAEQALEKLWDESHGEYFSRSFVSHELIEQSTIASLMPLYAGTISHERAELLVGRLKSSGYSPAWPVPSVPVDSPYFDDIKYWQGPTWINTNWLVVEGLQRYGFKAEADELRKKSLELVSEHGMNEYFNPLTGDPVGAVNFSWTAALTVDLLKN